MLFDTNFTICYGSILFDVWFNGDISYSINKFILSSLAVSFDYYFDNFIMRFD